MRTLKVSRRSGKMVARRPGIGRAFLELGTRFVRGRGRLARAPLVRLDDLRREWYVIRARLSEINAGSESHGVEKRSTKLQ